VDFDYGLLLATSALLDQNDPDAVAYRGERGFRPGREVQARLLMAGPGRQDLINEFGFDVTVPGYCSAFYPAIVRARPKPHGAFNPVSVPAVLAIKGLELQNWIGSEDAGAPALERLVALARQPERQVLSEFGLSNPDRVASRRALLTDLRNLSTLALQQDSYPGLMWADAVYGGPALSPETLAAVPPLYAAQALRGQIAHSVTAVEHHAPLFGPEAARITRGRVIFSERIVGEIANRQVLPRAPPAYAPDDIRGQVLAPFDPTEILTARLPVRCADCHNAAPLGNRVALATHPPPLGRCTHCHRIHPRDDDQPVGPGDEGDPFVSLRTLSVPEAPAAEVAYCEQCHHQHRDFGPLVYSSSQLFPFDADGDGLAQGDEADDARAGGIGTEPLLQVESPPSRPPHPRGMPVIRWERVRDRIGLLRMGLLWVRVAPLTAVAMTAPYLHNGSVPSLDALLEPAARRPVTFPLGNTGFVLDTRLPGNRNIGHEYGTNLSAEEKKDLVAFLRSL